MIFEQTYRKQTWYCVPCEVALYFYALNQRYLTLLGPRGKLWRYQFMEPNKKNLTYLRLCGVKIPPYNKLHCLMLQHEHHADEFDKLFGVLEVEY